jgi:hypothetical protein
MTLLLRRTLLLAGIAILLAVAALGVVRTSASQSPIPAHPAVLAAAPSTTPRDPGAGTIAGTDQTVDLGAAFGPDVDALLAVDQTTKPAAAAGRLRHLAAWRRLVHATVVVDLRQGGLTTIQLDHGTISAVTATTLTIKETGGGSVTVTLGDESRVRRDGGKAKIGDLKASDEVFVLSKIESGGTTAYLVVVPRT